MEMPQPRSPSSQQLMSLLTQQELLLSSKHQKEVEMLTGLLHRQLVSPRSYRNRLSALERTIELEKDGLSRSKQQIGEIIQARQKDDQKPQEKGGSEQEENIQDKGVERSKIDRIFNSFEKLQEQAPSQQPEPCAPSLSQPVVLAPCNLIEIINLEEEFQRSQPSPPPAPLLPPLKTDIYFIK